MKRPHTRRHRVTSSLISGVAFLGLVAMAPQAHAVDWDRRFAGILFPNPTGGPFGYGVAWAQAPSDEAVRAALPASVTVEGRTEWSCDVRADGKLEDCQLQASWPRDARYEQAGRKLIDQFVLSEASVKAAQTNGAHVMFSLRFRGAGLTQPDMKGCPEPFCTPAQPPAPQ